jgi:DNA sulfur modification protein DndD
LDEDQWDTFIKELIPPGISQLFFFDGEKIRKLSGDDDTFHPFFKNSIEALFGIDFLNSLTKDLSVYSKNFIDNHDDEKLISEKLIFEAKKETLLKKIDELEQDKSQLFVKKKRLDAIIELVESDMASVGSEFYEKFNHYKNESLYLQDKKLSLENTIRESCSNLFPFSICKNLCNDLINRLEHEKSFLNQHNANLELSKYIDTIKSDLSDNNYNGTINIDKKVLKYIFDRLDTIKTKNVRQNKFDLKHSLSFNLSVSEINKITFWINLLNNSVSDNMKTNCKYLRDINISILSNRENISRKPSKDSLQPYFRKLSDLNKDRAYVLAREIQIESQISDFKSNLKLLDTKINKIVNNIDDSDKINKKIKTISKVQNTILKFANQIKEKKISELEKAFMSGFSNLSHKKDLIRKIKINPNKFNIELFDSNGVSIPKHRLSSGEKQIFAISLLWALRQVSNRPIPVIIDTPLGRLDKDHRDSLVNQYFPLASHQTIILSTDTEIDRGFYDSLSTYLSHSYHLKFFDDKKKTVIETGYFK